MVVHQRRQTAAYADVDAHARVDCVHLIHVVPLAAGHHLQRQFVVVAQKDRPLAGIRDIRGLSHDFDHRVAVFLGHRHEQPRHQRKVVGHVAFVAIAEILAHVLRPLVGFGEQQAVLVMGVDHGAHLPDDSVGFRQVLVAGALAHAQVRDGVQAQAVHTHVQPEAHDADHGAHHGRVVVIQVRLVREKAMPVIGLGNLVPGPVGLLGVTENDAGVGELLVGVAPDVKIALG